MSQKSEETLSDLASNYSNFNSERDQIISLIGNFGRWQALILTGIITFFVVAINTWQSLVMTFHAPGIDYLCKPVVIGDNATDYDQYTYQQWQEIAHDLNGV